MANAPRDGNRIPTLLGVSSSGFLIPTTVAVNPSTHAMLVESSFTPSGTQDVNLTQVGSAAFSLGQQLAAASLPVVLTAAQITTLTPLSTVAVTQSTSPWIVAGGGTAGSAATGVVTVQGIASMTPVQVSQATGTNLHMVVDSGTITTVSTVTAVTAITNALPTGTNTIGGVNLIPATTGGLSTMNATSSDGATALTNSAQVIKASAGQLFGYYIYNPNATAQFVQFYNTAAASVTVGTTNPLFMLTIPATSAANLMGETGITFSNAGWSWAATSTAGGNGAPSTALDAVAFYK